MLISTDLSFVKKYFFDVVLRNICFYTSYSFVTISFTLSGQHLKFVAQDEVEVTTANTSAANNCTTATPGLVLILGCS